MTCMEPKKLALIRIGQILKEYSDFNHPLKQEDIAQRLSDEYGIVLERKAISRNISLLREAGADIITNKKGSYLASREFDDTELRLLIDGVLCSKYIPVGQTAEMIDQLCRLSNVYFRSHMHHVYSVNDWGKTDNQAVFYNIELIDEAIESKKQIHYTYNKYGMDGKLHKSSEQFVTPYLLCLHNQRYYLLAYSPYWENMVCHRLDHMTDMTLTDEPGMPLRSVPGYENGINYKAISMAMPYMYTDPPQAVEFLADASIVDQIVDWFGKNARITKYGGDDTKVRVKLKVSILAMEHWAMQYLTHVEILSLSL